MSRDKFDNVEIDSSDGETDGSSKGCLIVLVVCMALVFWSKGCDSNPFQETSIPEKEHEHVPYLVPRTPKPVDAAPQPEKEKPSSWLSDLADASKKADIEKQAELERLRSRVPRLREFLANRTKMDFVTSIRLDDRYLVYTVANSWFYEPKGVRLQLAQMMFAEWKDCLLPEDAEHARFRIEDQNGNKLGGLGFAGVYVND